MYVITVHRHGKDYGCLKHIPLKPSLCCFYNKNMTFKNRCGRGLFGDSVYLNSGLKGHWPCRTLGPDVRVLALRGPACLSHPLAPCAPHPQIFLEGWVEDPSWPHTAPVTQPPKLGSCLYCSPLLPSSSPASCTRETSD